MFFRFVLPQMQTDTEDYLGAEDYVEAVFHPSSIFTFTTE
jgi:hypothetical protein